MFKQSKILTLTLLAVASCAEGETNEHNSQETTGDADQILDPDAQTEESDVSVVHPPEERDVEVLPISWDTSKVGERLVPDLVDRAVAEDAASRQRRLEAEQQNPPDVPAAGTPMLASTVVGGPSPVPTAWAAANEWNDSFGRSVAIGDFDGDGYDDFVVGAPFEWIQSDRAVGVIFVAEGSSSGPTEDLAWSSTAVSGAEFGQFGWAMAVGDFNGDGKDDLAVSAPYDLDTSGDRGGAVYIFEGSSSGLQSPYRISQESLGLGNSERGDRFGWSLAAGDFNGDGEDDLAIGAPGETPGGSSVMQGTVFIAKGVYQGSLTGFDAISQVGLSTPYDWERFGASLGTGGSLYPSVENSNAETLVVGCFNDINGGKHSGAVYTYTMGSTDMVARERIVQDGLHEENDDFGWSIAIGDFNGDSLDDLAVGAPGENRDLGYVFVFDGDGWGVESESTAFSGASFDALPGARFGESLAAGEVTGSGPVDLLVGVPGAAWADTEDPSGTVVRDVGAVAALYGATSGLQNTGAYFRQTDSWTREGGERFGLNIAIGTKEDIAGHNYVLAGSPFEEVDGIARVGAAFLYSWIQPNPSFAPYPVARERFVQD